MPIEELIAQLGDNEFIGEITADPLGFLDSVLYSTPIAILQVLSLIISVLLLAIWIRLLRRSGLFKMRVTRLREAWQEAPFPKKKMVQKWQGIEERMKSNDDAQWKIAIIEADGILDLMIRTMGYAGDNMGERMRKIKPEQFPRLDDAWRAHKVRNFIAHDPTYPLKKDIAERTINIYRDVFKEFGVLE